MIHPFSNYDERNRGIYVGGYLNANRQTRPSARAVLSFIMISIVRQYDGHGQSTRFTRKRRGRCSYFSFSSGKRSCEKQTMSPAESFRNSSRVMTFLNLMARAPRNRRS